jgi:hypothetical protein
MEEGFRALNEQVAPAHTRRRSTTTGSKAAKIMNELSQVVFVLLKIISIGDIAVCGLGAASLSWLRSKIAIAHYTGLLLSSIAVEQIAGRSARSTSLMLPAIGPGSITWVPACESRR